MVMLSVCGLCVVSFPQWMSCCLCVVYVRLVSLSECHVVMLSVCGLCAVSFPQ